MIHKGASVEFLSSIGAAAYMASASSVEGALLGVKVSFVRKGGLDEMTFRLRRESKAPVYIGAIVRLLMDGVQIGVSYIVEATDEGDESNTLLIKCFGLYRQLQEKRFTRSWTEDFFGAIVSDLDTYLGDSAVTAMLVFFEDTSLQLYTPLHLEFEDASVWDAYLVLIDFAEAISGQRFSIQIDTLLRAYASSCEAIESNWFEGFQFDAPTVESDATEIVNSVRFYRALSTDTTKSEFVSAVEDADSITKYDRREIKFLLPFNWDTASCEMFAQQILSRKSSPLVRATLKNVRPVPNRWGFIPMGVYRVSCRARVQRIAFAEFDRLGEFDFSQLESSDATITLSTSVVPILTGRSVVQVDIVEVTDRKAIFTFANQIIRPISCRLFLAITGSMTVEYEDDDGNYVSYLIENNARASAGIPTLQYVIVEHFFTNIVGSEVALYANIAGTDRAIYSVKQGAVIEIVGDEAWIEEGEIAITSWGGPLVAESYGAEGGGQALRDEPMLQVGANVTVLLNINITSDDYYAKLVHVYVVASLDGTLASVVLYTEMEADGSDNTFEITLTEGRNRIDTIILYFDGSAQQALLFGEIVTVHTVEFRVISTSAIYTKPAPVNYLPTLRTVKLSFNDVESYFLDRMEIVTQSHPTNEETLEKADYEIIEGTVRATVELGAANSTLEDTLKSVLEKSNVITDLTVK